MITGIALTFTLTGCATILGGGPTQNVTLKSSQPKAHFVITSEQGFVVFDGQDPGVLKLERKHTYKVEISLDGYAKKTVMVNQGINGWFWGNLCWAGVVGMGVDFVTGSMWDLQPSSLEIKLETAMRETGNGFVVSLYTVDDNGQLRSIDIPLQQI